MFRRFALGLLLSAAPLIPVGVTGYASTPVAVTGAFSITIAPSAPPRLADGNQFIPFTFDEIITGDVAGERKGQGILIVHPDGTLNARDSGTFVGTALGSANGQATMTVEASGTFATLKGQVQVSDGVSGLTGVRGVVTFTGALVLPGTFAGSWSGQLLTGG